MVFSYYPGCTLSTTAKKLDSYARLTANVLGFQLQEIEDWQCCGAVFPLGTDEIAPKLAVIRALKAAQDKGHPLVTLCAACFHVFKQVNYQARHDKDFCATIKNYDSNLTYGGEVEVLHYMDVLKQYIGFDTIKEKVTNPLTGRKIGAYYGCMLLRPSHILEFDDPENPQIFEDFLKALGATPVPYPCRNECCGGYHSLQDKTKTAEMSGKVVYSATAKGATALITACPLCQYNIAQSQQETPIYYFTEILAEALGITMEGDESCA